MTLMLMGSFAWGNVIATFCGVIATLNPADTEYRHLMDELNRFVRMQGLLEMRRCLREYFHQTKHLQLGIHVTLGNRPQPCRARSPHRSMRTHTSPSAAHNPSHLSATPRPYSHPQQHSQLHHSAISTTRQV